MEEFLRVDIVVNPLIRIKIRVVKREPVGVNSRVCIYAGRKLAVWR